MREAYPAKVSATIRQGRGDGDLGVTELVLAYDGKKQVNGVSIMEFRAGKVARETLYFGDPGEPPAWRAQRVERTSERPLGQGCGVIFELTSSTMDLSAIFVRRLDLAAIRRGDRRHHDIPAAVRLPGVRPQEKAMAKGR